MNNTLTFQIPDGAFTTTDGMMLTASGGQIPPTGSINTVGSIFPFDLGDQWPNGYWLNGYWIQNPPFSYQVFGAPSDNKTEKAFHVAKALVANKRVSVKTPADFIALVEELKEVL